MIVALPNQRSEVAQTTRALHLPARFIGAGERLMLIDAGPLTSTFDPSHQRSPEGDRA
ncbi:hypothetical protein SAMN03159463_00849 [Mesorhizobium sp. NFR06]|nr:hypothetical protein SAMN03159463_00849 [Mesorhizobium sp. NFR06]